MVFSAESCIPLTLESASHTGVVECISHPSCNLDMTLQTLQSPSERHFTFGMLHGQFASFPPNWMEFQEDKFQITTNFAVNIRWYFFLRKYNYKFLPQLTFSSMESVTVIPPLVDVQWYTPVFPALLPRLTSVRLARLMKLLVLGLYSSISNL